MLSLFSRVPSGKYNRCFLLDPKHSLHDLLFRIYFVIFFCNNCQMQKVALMRCDCVSVCMCFSSVSTSVEDRRTHQSGDLRFHFPHPKFTSKRAKRRMVDEKKQQQLEAHGSRLNEECCNLQVPLIASSTTTCKFH